MSALATRPFTASYLSNYSGEHLLYEINMFYAAVATLTTPGLTFASHSAQIAFGVRNGMIEVFAIHLRNLIDFFYLDNVKPTDVVAADFCANGAWKQVRPQIGPTLERARIRANKEIAHLTTARMAGSPPDKSWNPESLSQEIAGLLQAFVATVDDQSSIHPSVRQRVVQCVSA